jgi:hypothetical protein
MRAGAKKKTSNGGREKENVEVAEVRRTTKNVQAVDCRLHTITAQAASANKAHDQCRLQQSSEDESFQGGSKCCLKG